MTNAMRFIRAYNSIDATLRSVYGFQASMGYAEVIRRAADKSSVVSAYESKLIHYGRLRNAIVHQGKHEEIIAEPHDDVVAEFEHIEAILCRPPLFTDCCPQKGVTVIDYTVPMAEAIERMTKVESSTMPVVKGGRLVGVLTNKRIVASIAAARAKEEDAEQFLQKTPVKDVILPSDYGVYYEVVGKDVRIDEILTRFTKNRKLLALVLTANGMQEEKPLSIVTIGDLTVLERILDDYT